MLNALEPDTVMPIHRPHASSETVVILRGKIRSLCCLQSAWTDAVRLCGNLIIEYDENYTSYTG